jgi:hypothetical protein
MRFPVSLLISRFPTHFPFAYNALYAHILSSEPPGQAYSAGRPLCIVPLRCIVPLPGETVHYLTSTIARHGTQRIAHVLYGLINTLPKLL